MNPDENANWEYKPSGATATAEPPTVAKAAESGPPQPASAPPPSGGSVSWTASEYIEHDRGPGWYLLLAVGTIVLAALVYLITNDYVSIGIIIVLGAIVSVFARRKPHQITYKLDESGLQIGQKTYPYGTFKSFAVIHDEALPSINLVPLKRFMPPISIYFAAPDEEQITSALGAHLPYQDQKSDRIDRLSRHLKF